MFQGFVIRNPRISEVIFGIEFNGLLDCEEHINHFISNHQDIWDLSQYKI